MTYAEALEHLYGLGPELAPIKPSSDSEPSSTPPRHKFDLIHMRRLCAALGDPQNKVPAVLIAGTNGKGSTSATLASILVAAGYRTGLYTSPHLTRVNERIQLAHPILPTEYGAPGANGPLALSPIPDDLFADLYTQVDTAGTTLVAAGDLPYPPSFFERLTAVAFAYFAHQQAEIMILEVGLGGRLDATNIVEPLISVITDIALDHQDYLGDTIALITAEKCGILREGGTLITLPQLPEANQAIGIAATALNVQAINAAQYIPPPQRASDPPHSAVPHATGVPSNEVVILSEAQNLRISLGSAQAPPEAPPDFTPHYHPHQGTPQITDEPGAPQPALSLPKGLGSETWVPASTLPRNHYTLSLDDQTLLQVDSPLPGTHQQRNIALAIATARAISDSCSLIPVPFRIPPEAIEQGIRTTVWPGRLELLPPNLLLDVAHNPAGAWTLRSALASLPEQQPRTLIFSCLKDKSLEEMSRILFPLFDSSPDADPLRRHDHIILAPIANPRAAAVEDLLAAAHALQIPAHAAPHLAAALAQAKQITPPGGLIIATGSVYLVGEIRDLALGASE
ncbi:bifunctional folylpolyglutamate synthase/dihydrofolate synthase [Granulicella tundricola]|nr:bifunctional folylpolyglutamate synthase/dihydrofolate synthase [Granulicella tundricola]